METFLIKEIPIDKEKYICIKKYAKFPVEIRKDGCYYAYYPELRMNGQGRYKHNNLARIKESVYADIRYYMWFIEIGNNPVTANDKYIVDKMRQYFTIKRRRKVV